MHHDARAGHSISLALGACSLHKIHPPVKYADVVVTVSHFSAVASVCARCTALPQESCCFLTVSRPVQTCTMNRFATRELLLLSCQPTNANMHDEQLATRELLLLSCQPTNANMQYTYQKKRCSAGTHAKRYSADITFNSFNDIQYGHSCIWRAT